MLDPLTAVSLAGTVVQFADFTTKLITKGYEVYQSIDGATVENRELEVVAISLQKHIGILSRSSREISTSRTGDEKALKDLFDACQAVAKELLEVLHRIKVHGTNRKWKSVQQALKSYWSQEKIDGLEKRISRLREQIAFHLLGILSKGQFTSLEILQKQNEELQMQIEGDNDRVMKELKMISSIKKENWQADNEQDVLRVSTMLSDMAKGDLKFTLRRRLAHSLRYSQMQDRHSGIAEAHTETYKWLFETDGVGLGKDLRHWLRNQNGIFWVTGKPGSGKSTLMKYLSGHKVTRTILSAWADPNKLIISHFYFWNPGSAIQKSQLGLLRTLLYEILRQCPDLISAVLPLRWQSYKLFGGNLHPWTLQELYEAFHLLRQQKNTFLKFCFFIDGLDEFDGSHTDLIKVVQSLASADNIKICASSREWNIFEDAFASCPKLLMQDVTRTDIAMYAETELGQNAHFKLLTQSEPDRAPELISEIVNKASGVFLWVFLVVRSLKEGLSNADRIGDLQRRLNALPTDLENYFAYILRSTDTFYFTQATQLFRLVLEATEPLSLLTLSFCDEEDPNFAIEMEVKSFTIPEITARCEAMRRRLNSRCKGLLEIRRRGGEQWLLDDIDQRPNSVVDFLHRTVRDFLDTPAIYRQFVAVDSETFNCYIVLLRAHVAMIKGLKIRQTKASDVRKRWKTIVAEFVVPVLGYAKQAEESTGTAHTVLLDETDRALAVIDENEEHADESNIRSHWSRHYYCDCHEDESQLSFLDLAVQWGLQKYVEEKFRELPKPLGNIFLVFALFKKPAHGPEALRSKPCIQLVQVILEHGADPNQSYKGWPDHDRRSIWELTLSRLSSSGSSINRPQEWIEIVELMILHDADSSITFSGGKSPIRLLREAFPSLGSDALDKLSVMLDESSARKNGFLTSQGMISLKSTKKVGCRRRGLLSSFFCWRQ